MSNNKASFLKLVATLLVITGSLNWLSIGLRQPNFVEQLAGANTNSVYIAVGVAGLYLLYLMYSNYTDTGRIEAYEEH